MQAGPYPCSAVYATQQKTHKTRPPMSEQPQIECPHFEHMLVLPHMAIHNFNAINSSHTCGISITAFIGAMHALE
ncbi:MAG: hypothetical protein KBH24_00355, partial [Brachymonas sp.]|nr:hypothetical protein [Brachymonas sp.]